MKQTRRSRRATRQRKRILMISGVVLAAILIVFLGVYLVLRHSVNKVEKDTIFNHVFIDKIDVSGMKSTQAKAAIEKKLEEYGAITVGLEAEEVKAEVLLSELGFQMKDVDKLVKKAVSYGKKGGVWSRYSLIKDLEEEAKVFDAVFAVDAQLVEKVIAEKIPELKNAAKDATITRQNDAFVITDEVKGVAVDVDESVKTIEKYFNTEWSYDTGNIKLVTKVDEPKVTRAQLETIKDVLGTFTTNCGTGGGRVQNIKTGAAHINGKLLMPGEEYSAEEKAMFIDAIMTNNDLLLKLVNDIVDLSCVESGEMKFVIKTHSASAIVTNAYKKYKATVPDTIDFRLAIPDDGGDESVDVDENRLDIIFNNLLTNAVKYTKEGSITIGWQRATGRYDVEIYVEDTGCGLADDDAKMVFNRFYKKDKFQQGTGLGLSICKAVAIRLDGDITVKSKIGEGTRFSVFLN